MCRPTPEILRDYEIIRTHYPTATMRQLQEMLPHRSQKAIYNLADRLGVKRSKSALSHAISEGAKRRKDVWTPEEDAILKRKYTLLSAKTQMEGRTKWAIRKRAYVIGARFDRSVKRIKIYNIWIYNAPTNRMGECHSESIDNSSGSTSTETSEGASARRTVPAP